MQELPSRSNCAADSRARLRSPDRSACVSALRASIAGGVNEQSMPKTTPSSPTSFLQSGSYMVAIEIHQMACVTLSHFVVTPTGFEPVTLRLGI